MFVVKFGFKIWNHSINDVTHLEKGGSAKSLFSKMGDKGEGGVTNLKKWVTSFIDGPLYLKPNWEYVQIRSYTILIELYNTMCPMFFSHTFSGLFLRKKKFSWKWHGFFVTTINAIFLVIFVMRRWYSKMKIMFIHMCFHETKILKRKRKGVGKQ